MRAIAFVADVSIVQLRPSGNGLTNSCVAIEWGWAEQALGSEAMIGVMNTAFGDQNKLPIDIRQRLIRSIYSLKENATDSLRAAESAKLVDSLSSGLKSAVIGRYFAGIHPSAPPLIASIVRSSEHGQSSELIFDQLASEYSLKAEVVSAIAEDLERLGMVQLIRGLGMGVVNIVIIPKLFEHFDSLYMGWNAVHDSLAVAKCVAERGVLRPADYATEVGWRPRRLNPALYRLIRNEVVLSADSWGGDFLTAQINRNNRTAAFAEGRLNVASALVRTEPAVWG